MTDEELKAWKSNELDINNELHRHFEQWGRWDWCEVADEARRIHNVMFDDTVEAHSAVDAITTAAVAHADRMAYAAMAAALGVDASVLRSTISEWSENQDSLPPPVTAERLMEMIEETKKERESHRLGAKG